jgi:Xaa-Pro aminopeptidase
MTLRDRIVRLQDIIRERGLVAAVLTYSRDIFYYTDTAQPGFLVVRPDDAMLFVRRGLEFAREEVNLPDECVVQEGSFRTICERMFSGPGAGERVGTELDVVSVLQGQKMRLALGDRELVDLSPDILRQRMIKDAAEIVYMRKACAAVQEGHLAAVANLRAGMSELELAAHVEFGQRLAGHDGVFFMRMADFAMSRGPVASGPNLRRTTGAVYTITGTGVSSAVPGGPSNRIMNEGDLVVVDIPACYNGYHSDQSRTYAVGHAPERAIELFTHLRNVADHLISHLRPGMTTGDAFDLTVARADEEGIGEIFRRFEHQPQAAFVAHGVGLELNEPPVLSPDGIVSLHPGMTLAIEMHVMEPEGLTVKLEDTVHLTPGGAEILTLSPRELIVVEG